MKRQRFRLGSVLEHYELQKQRAEQELQQAVRALQRIDEEIETLNAEVGCLAGFVGNHANGALSVAGWMACCRKSAYLGQRLAEARLGRVRQVEIVGRCFETRKRWAIAEETLLLLRRKIEASNRGAAAHAEQVQLQEMILRRSLGPDLADAPVS